MSVWRDMAKAAGMEPIDQAAAWIEEQERRHCEQREEDCREDDAPPSESPTDEGEAPF